VDHLVDTLFNEVEKAFGERHRSFVQKWKFCQCALPLAFDFDADIFLGTSYPGANESPCRRTFTYKGKCYWGGSLNYLLWGRAHGLCASQFPSQGAFFLNLSTAKAAAYKTMKQSERSLGVEGADPPAPGRHFAGIIAQAVEMTTCGFFKSGGIAPALEARCEPNTRRYPVRRTSWHFAGIQD
jgi:hypothetical protein